MPEQTDLFPPRSAPSRNAWDRFLTDPRWFTQPPPPHRFRLTPQRALLLFALAVFATGVGAAIAAATGLFRFFAPLALVAWPIAILLVIVAAATRRIRPEGDGYDLVAIAFALLL